MVKEKKIIHIFNIKKRTKPVFNVNKNNEAKMKIGRKKA